MQKFRAIDSLRRRFLPARRPHRALALATTALGLACLGCAARPVLDRGGPALVSQNEPRLAPGTSPGLTRYLSGSEADAVIANQGPALLLAGGGTDQLPAMQWLIDQVRGCSDCSQRIDMLILRASGADGYNTLFEQFKGLDSLETLKFDDRAAALDPAVAAHIAQAEVVFFAGGDQCRYLELFAGTPVQKALQSLYARGGGIGGTSAGLAIQGSRIYDGCRGSVTSPTALADPFDTQISFSPGLFAWPMLGHTLTDTHFSQRDRMGRLAVFVARGREADGDLRGLAVDEATALGVDKAGQALVFGNHHAYLLVPGGPPPSLQAHQPLSWAGLRLWRLSAGDRIDLAHPAAAGSYKVELLKGQFLQNPYVPPGSSS